jgi:hypothetical protein
LIGIKLVSNWPFLRDSFEGILWISLEHKFTSLKLIICTCYLPPYNSSRQIDVQNVYDNLLTDIYEFQSLNDTMFICGDVNSRCGDMSDFIEGIDQIQERL